MLKKVFSCVVVLIFVSGCLFAGGWNNTLMGCRAVALGAAFAAIADDPSAIYYNPAGMVFQEKRMNVSFDGFYVTPTHEYMMPTGMVAQSKYNVSFPQVFLTYKSSEKLTVGFGAYIPYAGGGMDWKKEELGFPFKSSLGIISLTPSLAYKVNEKLSLGFNLNFYHGVLEVNTDSGPYGNMQSEEKGSAITAGFGLMFKPNPRISFGLNIRCPAKMKLSGKTAIPITVPGFGTMDLKLESETNFNLPWDLELGVAFRIADNLLISTSAQYTLWSVLENVEKRIKGLPGVGDLQTEEPLDFKNIFTLRVGTEYIIPGGIFLRAGVGVDRSASPAETLSISNIDVDKFTILGGIGYRTGNVQLDFVYVHAQGKERERKMTSFGIPLTERFNLNASILGMGFTFSF